MRLEFEPNVTAFPLVENEAFEHIGHSTSLDLETLLKKGIAAAQHGDREVARTLLTQASEIDPHSEDAWMWLASISDYPEELLAFLGHVLDINPANERAIEWRTATMSLLAKTFVQRAVDAHEEGSDDLATQCLDQALVHDNDCEMAWFWKASLAASADQKLEYLERVLEINAGNDDARNAIAALKNEATKAIFEEAKAAAKADNRKKAFELVEEFLQSVPDNAEAWILRSHLSPGLDDKIEALEKALEIDPENAAARSGLAFLALTFGSAKEEVQSESHETPQPVEVEEPAAEVQEPAEFHEKSAPLVEFYGDPEAVEIDAPIAEYQEPEYQEEDPEVVAFANQPTDETIVIEDIPAEDETAAVQLDAHENISEDDEVATEPAVEAAHEGTHEESFDSAQDAAEPDHVTVESLAPAIKDAGSESFAYVESHNFSEAPTLIYEIGEVSANISMDELKEQVALTEPQADVPSEPFAAEMPVSDAQPEAPFTGTVCPYCIAGNDPQAFECASCHATLTLSDIESLLSNQNANREIIQHAVTQMEAEWNLREFGIEELTALGIGHFNLQNFEAGFKYVQEASRLDPNNVILSGQVNTLAIRLDEMRRQDESRDARPVGKTILVVDDSPTVRKLISGKLEKSGHSVVCAIDGVEALARLEESLPDLVLLDITMPRMDGYEVCKQIRANAAAKDLPVVMISGKDGFFDKVRGRMAGSTGYVTKPFGPETLMKALETYLLPDEEAVS